jgi:hypothetical protein
MKTKIAAGLSAVVLLVFLAVGSIRLNRVSREAWAMEFPVEGLVVPVHGTMAYESVPTEDIKNLSRGGFPEALRQLKARVRHLVIYQDCHYFFTTDGRVIVMTPGNDGRTPRLVETKRWSGAPHDFHDYRKELLPTT